VRQDADRTREAAPAVSCGEQLSNMASALERQCTLLIHQDTTQDDTEDLKSKLESPDVDIRSDALKRLIVCHLNGDPIPGMLMMVIRYILPHEDTHLRKLGLLFLEVVDKHGPDGKLLPEIILVCNMVRNELIHANEYTRGCALRFVCKIHDAEILEPLVPAIRQNLEHRHSFVRRNAVLAIHTIFESFEFLIPDAPELMEQFLAEEADIAAKRNAFVMLCSSDQDRAVRYLHQNLQNVATWGETLQLSALELVRRVCRSNPAQKGSYIKIIFSLLQSPSPAVVYESANTVISLSSAPTAIRAAAQSYCQLLASQSDNNIKLILLDRITELRKSQSAILQELSMDLMRALSSPNLDIRRKCVDIVMGVLTRRNVEQVVGVMKKELQGTQSQSSSNDDEYRQLLIKSIHTAALRFSEVAPVAVQVLTEFLGDSYGTGATDVITFVREVCEEYPELRPAVLSKLLVALPTVENQTVIRGALWILGSYSEEPAEVKAAFQMTLDCVGPLPLSSTPAVDETSENATAEEKADSKAKPKTRRPTVLADGTYATQIASESTVSKGAVKSASPDASIGPVIRRHILGGAYFLGVTVCTTLTKLVLRVLEFEGAPKVLTNKVKAQAMLVCASLLRYGRSSAAPSRIDDGAAERIILCVRTISGHVVPGVWLNSSREAFGLVIHENHKKKQSMALAEAKKEQVPVDELIDFRLLRARRASALNDGDVDVDELALTSATTGSGALAGFQLSRVTQLTGMSDPVYAEAHVTTHQYDIILDVLVINTTNDTLQNLTLELATMGDLRLCERPQAYTFGPNERRTIRANIKVSSTETGIIFGNIVYDVAGGRGGCVILNDIHVDIMDYIEPSDVTDSAFRTMWDANEWENAVQCSGKSSLSDFLAFIMEVTNMKCITLKGSENDSGYLSANLYAKSIFGEDALLNVCAEKASDGAIVGKIRIRSRTQGIALSLGDKLTLSFAKQNAVASVKV
jgi:coatomer subunit beta